MRSWVCSLLALAPLAAAVGCIPTPEPFGITGTDSGSPFQPTDPYVPGDTEGPGGPTSGETGGSETGGSETEGAGTDGGTDPGTSGGSSGGTAGGTDTGTPAAFPPNEPFGDDVAETDLIGAWGAPWDPAGVSDVTLTVGADGAFEWRETSADCGADSRATGFLWVESTQLVLHVESWSKRMPWDTENTVGLTVTPPFRLRLGYSPMGDYLGLAAPIHITAMTDWAGRSYDRVDAGSGPQARWAGEAELWALIEGEAEPQLIVRDRFLGDLEAGGAATLTHESVWFWPGPEPSAGEPMVQSGTWVDHNPGNDAGAVTIVDTAHVYDPSHMFTAVREQAFKRGVGTDC